jgi:hypothetical protein
MAAVIDCEEYRYQPIECKRQAFERTNDPMRSTTHGTSSICGVRRTALCGLHYNILIILDLRCAKFGLMMHAQL